MATASWAFQKHAPGIKRDPFEEVLFKSDEDNDINFARTDALIREAVQNALDAKSEKHNGPVRVRFHISTPEEELPPSQSEKYLNGLIDHLDALVLPFQRMGLCNGLAHKQLPVVCLSHRETKDGLNP